ncbi:hypothetical protein BJY16_005731 [Actinoplanes octamycinicus]|uniref:Uncharacterized protein n=1 Tax=Actinoplanes octamycinicus TaxID=135948 RepID=A0A7W7H1Q8_9ACTN|nr:hypothetical protein [Actinoplanes octamycinicus]MBB4742272.1 hypothetical protein [Actinoplanes octamycinicus]GIE59883.1 hypothetical protein Aoc01nite_52850 [Actinoplanes octamycinicus]
MIIPGYLDGYEPAFVESPLIDGAEMMPSELFWPAFLHTVGGSASAPHAFGIDPADLDDVIDALLDEQRWPVFTLRTAGAGRVHVVMRNFPDEGGVDYVLDPGTGDDAIPLADMEGHFRGPALAWPELIAAAQQRDADRTPAERLLLLLPVCADRDRPADAVRVVAAALTAVGVTSDARRVAEELLDSPRYWTGDCAWTLVGDARVCSGTHAYRRLGEELTPDQLRLVTKAWS